MTLTVFIPRTVTLVEEFGLIIFIVVLVVTVCPLVKFGVAAGVFKLVPADGVCKVFDTVVVTVETDSMLPPTVTPVIADTAALTAFDCVVVSIGTLAPAITLAAVKAPPIIASGTVDSSL